MSSQISHSVGIPEGVINIIPCSRSRAEEIGNEMCSSPVVKVLSFTGSTRVGQVRINDGNTNKNRIIVTISSAIIFQMWKYYEEIGHGVRRQCSFCSFLFSRSFKGSSRGNGSQIQKHRTGMNSIKART